MKIGLRLGAYLLTVLFMAGCGSDNSGVNSMTTGQFVDDPVQGLNYSCSSGIVGVTDSNGEYVCNVGDDVTFSIGTETIGTIAAQSGIITPYSIFQNNLDAALNLARLLQSIDTDSNDAVIILNPGLVALLPDNTDFSSATFEMDVEQALNIDLVSVEEAQNSLNDSILAIGEEIPDGGHIPVADAGNNQNVLTASNVTLNGSNSSDADGDTLTYSWSFISRPTDSLVTLSDATLVNPTFEADKEGIYVVQLIVNDGTVNSAADTVTITATAPTANAIPVADAGTAQNVTTTSTVTLDGSGSSDADLDTLTYSWSITTVPTGSQATLSNPGIVNPTFVADLAGSYVLRLIVNDGTDDSAPDTVTITATPAAPGITHNGTSYGTVISVDTGREWLDRNLGAARVCTAYNDSSCYGDYYQWGRNYDGHQSSSSSTTATQATDVTDVGHGNFITSSPVKQSDWGFDADANGVTRQSNWSATDGSSVCPVGYRVPTKAELQAETLGFLNETDAFNSFLKLPSGGGRDGDSGALSQQSSIGYLWTSSIDNLGTVYNYWSSSLYYYYLGADISADVSRGSGIAVRCIKGL